MAEVRLRLLSGFELSAGGEALSVQPAVQRVVAFVALTPRGVERDFAAYQLWPGTTETQAKANLRSTLWRLRALPVEVVRATNVRLSLAGGVWVDVRDGLEEELSSTRPFDTLQDELLPDWYDDWLVIERERLRLLRLQFLERQARTAVDDGDTALAIQTGLAAVAIDQHRESGHRVVIEAHLAEGNVAEAVREFDRYRTALAADLGLAPSHALVALMQANVGVAV